MLSMQIFTPKPIESKPLDSVALPIPEPGPSQIRVRVKVCGACHTDLHTVEGDISPPKLPITPGHQVIGTVDAVGESVDYLQIGDRVGIPWLHYACGECEFCLEGNENLCPNARFTGFHVDGGFAEYMIAEASYTLVIPDEMSDEQAAPLLCAGIIGYRSLLKADVLPGERLGLFGFGASAHLTIQVARYWGCEVYVFTRSEQHREHALKLGAAWVGGADDIIPETLDRAIIFAPAGWIVPIALGKLRSGGTLAINAIYMSSIPEMPYQLIYGEKTLRSVTNATYQDGKNYLELAAKIPIKATVTTYNLEDANNALFDMKHSRINGEAVLKVG